MMLKKPERPNVLRQFTTTSTELLGEDATFWINRCEELLELYAGTSADDEDSRSAKGVMAATIAGFALAMANHFSSCAESCIDMVNGRDDADAAQKACVEMFGRCEQHTREQEEACLKALN